MQQSETESSEHADADDDDLAPAQAPAPAPAPPAKTSLARRAVPDTRDDASEPAPPVARAKPLQRASRPVPVDTDAPPPPARRQPSPPVRTACEGMMSSSLHCRFPQRSRPANPPASRLRARPRRLCVALNNTLMDADAGQIAVPVAVYPEPGDVEADGDVDKAECRVCGRSFAADRCVGRVCAGPVTRAGWRSTRPSARRQPTRSARCLTSARTAWPARTPSSSPPRPTRPPPSTRESSRARRWAVQYALQL